MDKFQNKYLEIKNINKDFVSWIEDSAEENDEETADTNTDETEDAEDTTTETEEESASDTHNSCFDQADAIGWLVCPTTGVIAKAVDNIYSIIENFLTIDPVITQENSPMRIVWSYCRDITNIVFIIFIIRIRRSYFPTTTFIRI